MIGRKLRGKRGKRNAVGESKKQRRKKIKIGRKVRGRRNESEGKMEKRGKEGKM